MTEAEPTALPGPGHPGPPPDGTAGSPGPGDAGPDGAPAGGETRDMDVPLPLNLDFLFRLKLRVGAPQLAGSAGGQDLRIVPVTGGEFCGPRMQGEVMPGTAADWLRLDPDGTAHMDVRLTLRTEGGAVVLMTYTGVRTGPEEVLARLAQGEAVSPGDYYFRTAIRFETGAPDLLWMNRVIAVGTGQRPPEGPVYDVYEVR